MPLELYFHPLSSFCQKVLIALYENDTPFAPRFIDLGDPGQAAELKRRWPLGKFPVLYDSERDRTVPESSIIIEYLAQHYPGPIKLVPDDPDAARQTRLRDRFYDLHVEIPMQKIVGDRLRPPDQRDAYGVAQAQAALRTAYDMIESEMATRRWAMGDEFGMADCAAAPALSYAELVVPFADSHPKSAAYLRRLEQRPSYARVLREAEPYRHLFPR
jgi:glutathione S-transferase